MSPENRNIANWRHEELDRSSMLFILGATLVCAFVAGLGVWASTEQVLHYVRHEPFAGLWIRTFMIGVPAVIASIGVVGGGLIGGYVVMNLWMGWFNGWNAWRAERRARRIAKRRPGE